MNRNAPTAADVVSLVSHIAALEKELARYAVKYGMSDEVRRLLCAKESPLRLGQGDI